MTDDVREHELHAYVDGALPEARHLEVEAWLAAHPADAARVQAWAAQNQSLHGTFDAVLNEPLSLDLVRATRRLSLPVPFRAVAALLAMMVTRVDRLRDRPRHCGAGARRPGVFRP